MLNHIKVKVLVFHILLKIIPAQTAIIKNDLLLINESIESELKMWQLRSPETSYQKFPKGKPYY